MGLNDRGSVSVEFVLIIPVVLLLIVAIIEIAGLARLHVQATHAAREGARAAATISDPDVVIETVNRALGESAARARVTVERTWMVGGPAIVRVEVPHRVMSRLFGGFDVLLRGTSTMRVER